MDLAKVGSLPIGLHIQDEVDVALAEPQHILRSVPICRRKAHLLEQGLEALRLWRGELHELKPVRSKRIIEQVAC